MRIAYVLSGILIVTSLVATGCLKDARVSDSPVNGGWGEQADRLYPPSDVLQGYRAAFELYRAKKLDEGLASVRGLVQRPLRLAPDDVLQDQRYFTVYLAGRQIPSTMMLRRIWRENRDYSAKQSQAGQRQFAQEIQLINLAIAHQVIHAKPSDLDVLVTGVTLWWCTWEALGPQLADAGDQEASLAATRRAEQAKRFFRQRVQPFAVAQSRQLHALEQSYTGTELEQRTLRVLRSSTPGLRDLVDLWDAEVENEICGAIFHSSGKRESKGALGIFLLLGAAD